MSLISVDWSIFFYRSADYRRSLTDHYIEGLSSRVSGQLAKTFPQNGKWEGEKEKSSWMEGVLINEYTTKTI